MIWTARHYPDWKAPSEDGAVLIWPEPQALVDQTRQNQRLLGSAERLRIQNVPLPELRRRMRKFIGHEDDDRPLVATGHQTELHHPGVWVKNALINALANRLDGQAYHLAVDTDSPKHLQVRWPGRSVPLTDDPGMTAAAWSGLLRPPTPAHLDEIAREFRAASSSWSFDPLLPRVLSSLRRLSLESLNLSTALANALHELDWDLGLRHHVLTASPIWTAEPFLVFIHHLLAKADRFALEYNAALAAFRSEHHIHGRSRPMPDLFFSDESVEVPFWLDDLHTGRRTRPSVFRAPGGGFTLELVNGEEFVFDPMADGDEAARRLQRWLSFNRHRLSPRALILTAFFRLLLVDQFVHGIGGGRYDQVTDQLIAGYFDLEPPRFSVTTGTLYFPGAVEQQRVCLPCVVQEGHRLRHSLLGDRKLQLVAEIDSLPRRSRRRAERFYQMHNELAAANAGSPLIEGWQRRLAEAQQRHKQEQALFDRELFYAIQPRQRLADILHRYDQAIGTP